MKEAEVASEIIAVTIGPKKSSEQLRTAMATGCDRSIHILTKEAVSRILEKIVPKESPNLVLMGKQAIDGDNNATGQMLAGRLGWPQATFASKIDFLNAQVLAFIFVFFRTRFFSFFAEKQGIGGYARDRWRGAEITIKVTMRCNGRFKVKRAEICHFTEYYESEEKTHRRNWNRRVRGRRFAEYRVFVGFRPSQKRRGNKSGKRARII